MTNSMSLPAIWVLLLILPITLVTCVFELDFRVIPAVVQPLETTNVTLQCFVNVQIPDAGSETRYRLDGSSIPYSQRRNATDNIALIRILKNFQEKWQPIAQVSYTAPTIVHKLDESISFTDGSITAGLREPPTFIKITWEVASVDVFGTYRCDTVNFDSKQNAVLTTTSEISLGSSLNALDLLRLLNHNMGTIGGRIERQEQTQRSDHTLAVQLKSDLKALREITGNKVQKLEENTSEQSQRAKSKMDMIERRIFHMETLITKRLEDISVSVNFSIESAFSMLWPRGSYGLLQPDSGCPLSGITNWETGWIKHHTESTDRNEDAVSAETHFQQPILEREGGNNFITQHFCIKDEAKSLGRQWPSGSYCVNKKDTCPDKFQEAFVKWDEENDGIIHTYNGSLPSGIFTDVKIITIEYCCRQDGPVDTPIHLPNLDPFYLYRYGGTCQKVHGMTFTEEFIVFDTENTNNHDQFSKIHPDGKIKNVRLELCHYRKK